MQVQLMIEPHDGASYDDQLAVARLAQECGLAGLFRADHYHSAVPRRSDWHTDTWVTLAGLARDTTGITLGSLVSAATFRLPATLAITAAQVDAMSGGRLEVGIGAAWWQAEHSAYGIPFPPTGQRFDQLAEQLAVITGLWRTPAGQRFSFDGQHYQLHEAAAVGCLRPGGPPIIIGGSGARRTPQLAARYAREFNSGWQPPAATAAEFDRVRRECRRISRDPAGLRCSTTQTLCIGDSTADFDRRRARWSIAADDPAGIIGTPAQALDRLAGYREAGAQRIYLELLDISDHDQLRLFAEQVLPELA